VAWVFFRADSAATAANMVAAMFGNDGYSLLAKLAFPNELVTGRLSTGCALLAALALVLIAPNTIQLMASFQPVIENVSAAQAAVRWQWRPTLAWGFVAGGLLATGIALMSENSPFLYFQF
jgi:alginate O-acetyltransferase complex protein AlgI